MRFASKGQPRASASRNSCALSPALSPRSTQTRTRGGDSPGGRSEPPTLTAIFTAFPVFFKGMMKNSSLLTNHERKYNPHFERQIKKTPCLDRPLHCGLGAVLLYLQICVACAKFRMTHRRGAEYTEKAGSLEIFSELCVLSVSVVIYAFLWLRQSRARY